ncbi:MAG: metallophosphoesterase family protein [Halobacteriales archaeon]
MKQVALISDTHIPSRASRIPEAFERRVRDADHVVHAGDFTDAETLDRIRELAGGDLTAVRGNMDRGLDLPATETVEIEGVTFVVTHGTGSPAGYESRVAGAVRERADEDAIGVAGHTHEVLEAVVDGVRILNPGSATGAAPADRTTMMTAAVEDCEVDVTLHEQ